MKAGFPIRCGRRSQGVPPRFRQTGLADDFPAEVEQLLHRPAEYATGIILLQYDLVVVHKDLHTVVGAQIHHVAQLLGQNDAAEMIHLAHNADASHNHPLSCRVGKKPFPSNISLFWDDQRKSFPLQRSNRIIPFLGNLSNLLRRNEPSPPAPKGRCSPPTSQSAPDGRRSPRVSGRPFRGMR